MSRLTRILNIRSRYGEDERLVAGEADAGNVIREAHAHKVFEMDANGSQIGVCDETCRIPVAGGQ